MYSIESKTALAVGFKYRFYGKYMQVIACYWSSLSNCYKVTLKVVTE